VRTMAYSWQMKLRGVYNLTVQRTTDNIMRKMNDEKWFIYKKKLAHERAEKAIQKLDGTSSMPRATVGS